MDINKEFEIKIASIREYLSNKSADVIALQRTDNFAWATCGGSDHVNTATDYGVATMIIKQDAFCIATNRIEAGRLKDEELGGLPIEIVALEWADSRDAFLSGKLEGKKILADHAFPGAAPLSDDFIELQMSLTESEVERFRAVGKDSAEALEAAARSLKPGMTEFEVAGLLSAECYNRGIVPIVALVAADERLLKYRHPLPTGNKIEKTAMIVVCGRRSGLIASATRIVSFGAVSADLARRHAACARVDATFNGLTRPGVPIADVFRAATAEYKAAGFDGEWLLHHQGGPAGYRTRYYTANEKTAGVVKSNSVFAWNPSITGTKVEDTIIVGEKENTFITQTGNWPYIDVEIGGKIYRRPDILVK
ncbi:MAG: M24 family metallopeptidase [bacterium]